MCCEHVNLILACTVSLCENKSFYHPLIIVTCNFIFIFRVHGITIRTLKKYIYIYTVKYFLQYIQKNYTTFYNTIKNACFPWMLCILITDYFKKYSLQPDLNELRDSACRRPVGKLFHKTAPLYLKLFFR